MHRLMVVAHPDDELLYGAGLMLANPGDWTVICCVVPKIDPMRSECFLRSCKALGANGINLHIPQDTPLWIGCSLQRAMFEGYDHVVTHGLAGEYGHVDHKALHKFIAEWVVGIPKTFFGWKTGKHTLQLTPGQVKQKEKAFAAYDYKRTMYSSLSDIAQGEALKKIHYRDGFTIDKETYDGAWPIS